jgi:hypothetical protein
VSAMGSRCGRIVGVVAVTVVACLAMVVWCVGSASAVEPWWEVTTGSRPSVMVPGSEAEIVVGLQDLGDANVDGKTSPVRIVDTLPAGLKAVGIYGLAPELGKLISVGSTTPIPLACSLATLTCTFDNTLVAYNHIEILIRVKVEGDASPGEVNGVSVTGGGAPSASVSRPVGIGESTPFGIEDFRTRFEEEGGTPDTRAGSHPFQFTTTVALNEGPDTAKLGSQSFTPEAGPVALAKDVDTRLPAGFVGNPTFIPTCSAKQFLNLINGGSEDECPPQTAIGVVSVNVDEPSNVGQITFTVPLFNLEAYFGEPARFGFYIPGFAEEPVYLDTTLRDKPGEDYGITVNAANITQVAGLVSVRVTVWGTPYDPRHDSSRGWGCLQQSNGETEHATCTPTSQGNVKPLPFLMLPTSCATTLVSSVEVDSWVEQGRFQSYPLSEPMDALGACNQVPFAPSTESKPSTQRASAPTGLDFNVDFNNEGLLNPDGLSQSELKDTTVVLPEGLTINPSAGVGLGGCSEAEFASETMGSAPGTGCPPDSKLGTVEARTQLLVKPIHGALYIAQPYANRFGSLVALFIVFKDPETGVLIRLAGKVTPNLATGQLTTTFEDNPQVPLSHFNFHFREGQQAPLISPPLCGTYSTQSLLTPWSEPATPVTDTSSFQITQGYDGGPCPSGGVPPFNPGIVSGQLNNNAGSFSPFYLHLTRTDAEQEISGFSTNLPSGLTGDLSGIPFCPEAAIEAARAKTGAQEEASPSCPAASRVGHTLVGTGVGAVLAYVPGKIYLAGPFHGAPFSLVSVTSAVVGPFDLGTVVLRFGLTIDPYTARVSVTPTSSEPIPTILKGIVTHVRDIRVYIDRPHFTLNPTSCNPLTIGSTLTSDLGATKTVTSPFQASNCQALGFKPIFKVSTAGKTSRKTGASLKVKLSYPTGSQANISKVKVDLPKQLPSRLTTLQKACTAAQFEANPAGCPAASIIGHAKAITPLIPVPLEGPAYFVSHGGEAFPSLIMVLQGYGVTIDLVGTTFINKAGITSSTFKTVPDQPVGSFELTLPQGPFSALAANGNLCKAKLTMPTQFDAQNGMVVHQSTKISVTGCPKQKAKKASKHHRGQSHGKKR